jgi:hypothetical protein
MRRTPTANGVFRVAREELAKAFAVLRHDLGAYGNVLKGQDGMDEEAVKRAEKVRAAYAEAGSKPKRAESLNTTTTNNDVHGDSATAKASTADEYQQKQQRQQHQRQQEQEQAQQQASKPLTWAERWAKVKDELMTTFGPKAGVAAIISHCTKSHAASVAVDLDIDVKSVEVRAEKGAVGEGTKVVGYIDAPAASQEEVMVFAEKLTKSCPAARTYGDVEWRTGRPR